MDKEKDLTPEYQSDEAIALDQAVFLNYVKVPYKYEEVLDVLRKNSEELENSEELRYEEAENRDSGIREIRFHINGTDYLLFSSPYTGYLYTPNENSAALIRELMSGSVGMLDIGTDNNFGKKNVCGRF